MLFVALTFSATVNNVLAQDWYGGLSVGISHSLGENMSSKDMMKNAIPSVAVSLGDNITPVFGLRLQAAFRPQVGRPGNPQQQALPATYDFYRFNTLTADLSVTLNLTNMFLPTDPLRTFEGSLIIGGGMLNTSWFSSKVQSWEYYPVVTDKKSYPTVHFGIQGQVRLNKHWKAIGELKGYGVENEYNGVKGTGAKYEAFLDFQLGVIYYFSSKKHTEIEAVDLRHNYMPEYVDDRVFNEKGVALRNVMFYLGRNNLATSQLALLADVAQYMMANPKYKLKLCGYPDDAAHDMESNKRLAQRRLDIVREELIQMGVADEQLIVTTASKPVIEFEKAGDWVVGVGMEVIK